MKKLFRFKYEPCNGTCYAHEPIFFKELSGITNERREILVNIIVKAHDKLCDNPEYSFGIDLCEKSGIFIGHFRTPEKIDIYTGHTLEEACLDLCKAVIQTEIPILEGQCTFGDNGTENLAKQILAAVA